MVLRFLLTLRSSLYSLKSLIIPPESKMNNVSPYAYVRGFLIDFKNKVFISQLLDIQRNRISVTFHAKEIVSLR